MLKRMKIGRWMILAVLLLSLAVMTACTGRPSILPISEEKLTDTCIAAMKALTEGESHCILHEQELSDRVRKTEYRRYDNDQLVLILGEGSLDNRIYADGKYGATNGEEWVWENALADHDANAWLREWSPEYLETNSWSRSGNDLTCEATWLHPLHAQRLCSGTLTYRFSDDGALESVHREYVVLEGDAKVGGSVETITVLEEPVEETKAFIRSVASRCVTREEAYQEKPSEPRERVEVSTVNEFLAAIGPNREIVLKAGTYDLTQAGNYGLESGSDYYFWEDMSDGYELVIRGVRNLVIRGEGMHATKIETLPRYADVLHFQDCTGLVLSDFTAGHTDGYGECGAGVIYLYLCSNADLSKMGLYGCGCVGLEAESCGNVSLSDSDIYDCSSSAAVLRDSIGVEIEDCRIYRIGHELYGGYCVFEAGECENVRIEGCEIYDSRTASLLCAFNNQDNVVMKNNMIRNNRFGEAAIMLQGCKAMLENNQFQDNSIRNWYRLSSDFAVDEQGTILTEEVMNERYGSRLEEPVQLQLEIHVSTVDEFLAAIGPNKKIVLDAELYDLSKATGYGWTAETYYYWQTDHDGFGLVIRDVDNMTICGKTGYVKNHTIVAVPRWSNVLMFRACSNITVSGFTAGHTQGQGSCTGGVLRFEDSDRILVDNCGLFGCGTKGVDAENCSDVTVENCEIYECSEGGIEMRNTNTVMLENNTFRDIAGRNYLSLIGCMDVTMDGEILIQENMISAVHLSNDEQLERNALEDLLSKFEGHYWRNEAEELKALLSDSYIGDGSTYGQDNGDFLGIYYEITFDHVREIENKGSLTVEIPYRPYKYDDINWEVTRYLLVTVVKENGEYRISDYQQKK